MSYCIGLLSEIPMECRDGDCWTLDLWAKDLEAQCAAVDGVVLFAPVIASLPTAWGDPSLLPRSIRIVDANTDHAVLAQEIAKVDVVQIPGNFSWARSRRARRFARLARAHGKAVILGISSDRAKTGVVNERGNWMRKGRARLAYASIRLSQSYLAWRADGTFVVGEGLRRLARRWSSNVFVGTASWIRELDLQSNAVMRERRSLLRLCAAARLEPMKGLHIALKSMVLLRERNAGLATRLQIAGQGPEESSLRAITEANGLQGIVRFVGALAYPEPFFEFLRGNDIVVFTNLNDEQPRLIFDAISQGCLIICPDSLPYRALGIPDELLYERGDASALADRIVQTIQTVDQPRLMERLRAIARGVTIENMHATRRDWICTTVLRRPTGESIAS